VKQLRHNSEWIVDQEKKLRKVIDGCLANDRRAQEQLFRTYYGRFIVVVLRYISDRDTAEEILQNGFIKIFDKLAIYDFKGSFDGWMRRIIVNTTIDHIRKTKKNVLLSGLDDDFVQENEDHLIGEEEVEFIKLKSDMALKAIQQLSPIYRMVFNLFVIENYSHREIAEKLGITQGTSKSNLAKAKIKLKQILTEQYDRIRL